MAVIIFKGKESIKKIEGKDKKVIPFAGTDREGENSQMGVGLIYPDEKMSSFWGLLMPHNIVASYRGMKLAEEVPQFNRGTLAACWYAGQVYSGQEGRYISEIERLIGTGKRQRILQAPFKRIIGAYKRQRILQAPLPSFDDAIKLMQEKGIEFDVLPFVPEIQKGNLAMTPLLEQIIKNNQLT
jgi:hypothetical protein